MRRKLFRPTGCGIPIALMLAALAGQTGAATALAAAYLSVTILSLGAAETLRRTASQLSSHQQVLGAGLIALLQTLLAGVLTTFLGAAALTLLHTPFSNPTFTQKFSEHLFDIYSWGVAGTALAGTRCLEELAHAEGDATSGSLADFLGGLAAIVPMLVFRDQEKATMIGTAGAFGVSLLIILLMRRERPQFTAAGFGTVLGATLREAMYPILSGIAMAILLCMMPEHGPSAQTAYSITTIPPRTLLPGFFAGLAVVAAARTTYRRDESESRAFHITMATIGFVLALAAAVPFALSALHKPLTRETTMIASGNLRLVLAAIAVGFVQYAACKPRYIITTVMYFAIYATPFAWAFVYNDLLVIAMTVVPAAVALALTVPDWMEVHRRRRAMKIRRRAMKQVRK